MKKLRAFLTMTIMGIFICAAALRTEAAERPSAVVDNIVYRKNYENDNWCVYSCDKELDYGTVYIKENVNGNVIDEIESSAFKDSKIKKIVIPPSIKKYTPAPFKIRDLQS